MGREDVARDFLSRYLPASVGETLDFATLQTLKDSFVDAELLEHFSDLLFQVEVRGGGSSLVSILFEHKSYPDPQISLQLLRYQSRIWETSLKQREVLRPILPIVVYHGTKRWDVGERLSDAIVTPASLRPYFPDFGYWLFDLSDYSDEQMTLMGGTALILRATPDFDWKRVVAQSRRHQLAISVRHALRYLDGLDIGLPVCARALRELERVPSSRAQRHEWTAQMRDPQNHAVALSLWLRGRAYARWNAHQTRAFNFARYLRYFWGLESNRALIGHGWQRLTQHLKKSR